VKPAPFEYHAPAHVDEAVALLHELRDQEPKVLAGGQSLVPAMNLRLARPTDVIDLNRTEGLAGIAAARDGWWRLGAMTRHATVEDSADLRQRLPLVPHVVGNIGYRQIRHRGTVGGSLCHADPSAEWPLLARLLRAEIDLRSVEGERTVAADDFFAGVFTTGVQEHEVLTGIRFAQPPAPWRWGFAEFARTAGDFAIVAVGAVLRLAEGVVADADVVAAGAGSTPVRLASAQSMLVGSSAGDSQAIARGARAAADEVEPFDDVHASAAFKRHLVSVLTRRALEQATDGDRRRTT